MKNDKENNMNEKRISRGYRLRTSTHNLIKSLQELTQYDADTIIAESVILMYKKILAEKERNIKTNIIS